MKLSELMTSWATECAQRGIVPGASFEGWAMADDMVLAVDTSATQDAAVGDYAVVQVGTKSVTASLNPETKESAYIRAGKSTVKTGNQRTIAFELDRYHGDTFQDFADSLKYATGNAAVVNYVYFSRLTLSGEKGTATLSMDTDGSGNAEENSAVSGTLSKTGAKPEDYTWTPTSTTFAVYCDPVGGTISDNVTSYTYGTGVTLPVDVTRSSYEFAGWYTNSAYSGEPVEAISAADSGDKMFFAKWTPST